MMLQLVLSYNPLWLRIGLETVYGELLHLNSNSDMTGITRFIITRYGSLSMYYSPFVQCIAQFKLSV